MSLVSSRRKQEIKCLRLRERLFVRKEDGGRCSPYYGISMELLRCMGS